MSSFVDDIKLLESISHKLMNQGGVDLLLKYNQLTSRISAALLNSSNIQYQILNNISHNVRSSLITIGDSGIEVCLMNFDYVPDKVVLHNSHQIEKFQKRYNIQIIKCGELGACLVGQMNAFDLSKRILLGQKKKYDLNQSLETFSLTAIYIPPTNQHCFGQILLWKSDQFCFPQYYRFGARIYNLSYDFGSSVIYHMYLYQRSQSLFKRYDKDKTSKSMLIPYIKGVLYYEKYENLQGLLSVSPFQSDRIPVILVHGFLSNPSAWLHIILGIQNNEYLAKRIQVIYWQYPTGSPLLQVAQNLRSSLQRLKQRYPPEHQKFCDQKILIGMSMGGVLVRLMVSKSQVELFDPQSIVKRLLNFDCISAHSAIFIGTPHKGIIGKSLYKKLLLKILKIPKQLQLKFKNQIMAGTSYERQSYIEIQEILGSLDSGSSLCKFISQINMSSSVDYYSFIGQYSGRSSLFHTIPRKLKHLPNDGVVQVESAQLGPLAIEELIVDSEHLNLLENQAVINGIQQILIKNFTQF